MKFDKYNYVYKMGYEDIPEEIFSNGGPTSVYHQKVIGRVERKEFYKKYPKADVTHDEHRLGDDGSWVDPLNSYNHDDFKEFFISSFLSLIDKYNQRDENLELLL